MNPANAGERTRILLVEDDVQLCSLMQEFFAEHGMQVEAAHEGGRGLVLALKGCYDLLLLDAMLPNLDGFELLRQLRARSEKPVIMLTARVASEDRIAGLEIGADDYLPKPFSPQELLARVRAVLRRTSRKPVPEEVLEVGPVRIDPGSREVWSAGQPVELTSIEYAILDALMRAAGRVVTRDELTWALYRHEPRPLDRSLDVHVGHLRKKLGRASLIRTIRGEGYFFCAGAAERGRQ